MIEKTEGEAVCVQNVTVSIFLDVCVHPRRNKKNQKESHFSGRVKSLHSHKATTHNNNTTMVQEKFIASAS